MVMQRGYDNSRDEEYYYDDGQPEPAYEYGSSMVDDTGMYKDPTPAYEYGSSMVDDTGMYKDPTPAASVDNSFYSAGGYTPEQEAYMQSLRDALSDLYARYPGAALITPAFMDPTYDAPSEEYGVFADTTPHYAPGSEIDAAMASGRTPEQMITNLGYGVPNYGDVAAGGMRNEGGAVPYAHLTPGQTYTLIDNVTGKQMGASASTPQELRALTEYATFTSNTRGKKADWSLVSGYGTDAQKTVASDVKDPAKNNNGWLDILLPALGGILAPLTGGLSLGLTGLAGTAVGAGLGSALGSGVSSAVQGRPLDQALMRAALSGVTAGAGAYAAPLVSGALGDVFGGAAVDALGNVVSTPMNGAFTGAGNVASNAATGALLPAITPGIETVISTALAPAASGFGSAVGGGLGALVGSALPPISSGVETVKVTEPRAPETITPYVIPPVPFSPDLTLPKLPEAPSGLDIEEMKVEADKTPPPPPHSPVLPPIFPGTETIKVQGESTPKPEPKPEPEPKTITPFPIPDTTFVLDPQLPVLPKTPSPLDYLDYLKPALTIAGLIGGGSGGSGAGAGTGTTPGGSGLMPPSFTTDTLPTGDAIPPFGGGTSPTSRTARDMGDIDWNRYGFGPERSFFANVPQRAAKGGAMAVTRPSKSFAVQGAGDGRSDDIPAVLSDGEYVIDAETVALLGNGSNKAGAAQLDRFRANVRKHKGKDLAKGRFSVNAKAPQAYMAGGRS